LTISEYKESDLTPILALFYDTVHTVNSRDYDKEQVEGWAPVLPNKARWAEKLKSSFSLVARKEDQILCFGELSQQGMVESLYVHKDFQRQKLASSVLILLEKRAKELDFGSIRAEVSITAKPFFENQGFEVIEVLENIYKGKIFRNYLMEKALHG
jgi:putative acetyltransferase